VIRPACRVCPPRARHRSGAYHSYVPCTSGELVAARLHVIAYAPHGIRGVALWEQLIRRARWLLQLDTVCEGGSAVAHLVVVTGGFTFYVCLARRSVSGGYLAILALSRGAVLVEVIACISRSSSTIPCDTRLYLGIMLIWPSLLYIHFIVWTFVGITFWSSLRLW